MTELPDVFWGDELWNSPEVLPEEILAGGVLDVDSRLLITGNKKAGKSLLVQWLQFCLAEPRPFLLWDVPVARSSLYVQLEVGRLRVRQRSRKLSAGFAPDSRGRWAVWTQRSFQLVSGLPGVRHLVEERGIEVVIFDPLYLLHTSDENSNTEIATLLRLVDTMLAYTKAVVLVHHHGHGGDARGATNLTGWPDSWIKLEGERPAQEGLTVKTWFRNAEDEGDFGIRLLRDPLRWEVQGPQAERDGLALLEQLPGKAADLVRATGWSQSKVYRVMDGLERQGLAKKEKGLWLSA